MFSSVMAQRRSMGGLRPGSVLPSRLLMMEEVQSELKLTDEQKSQAAEINEKLTVGRHDLFAKVTKESGERAGRVDELENQARESIAKLLDDAQEKRLQELLLQVNGASELRNQEVSAALKITKDQQKKLAEVRRENAKARQKALTNFDGDRMAKSLELQREADAKLLKVLTDDQRKQFEKMQGKKLAIQIFPSEAG
jgi:DNA-binding MarR family transcriptional regulator